MRIKALRRPASYLDASVRSAISTFAKLRDVTEGLSRLERGLRSGDRERRYGATLGSSSIDLG
jgi:hypothetical protein